MTLQRCKEVLGSKTTTINLTKNLAHRGIFPTYHRGHPRVFRRARENALSLWPRPLAQQLPLTGSG
jgi:hypothetical protein